MDRQPDQHWLTQARAALLLRLNPAKRAVAALARSVLTDVEGREQAVIEAAVKILGATRVSANRAAVREYARTQDYTKRAGTLAALSDPISVAEAESVTEQLQELKARGGEVSDWAPVATLLARLPAHVTAAFLAEPFSHGTGRSRLFQTSLIATLGADKLRAILEQLDDEVLAREILTDAATSLPQNDQVAFAVWAHGRFNAADCQPIRDAFALGLGQQHFYGENPTERSKEALWACALAGHELDAVDPRVVPYLDPTQPLLRADSINDECEARQLGRIAARMLSDAGLDTAGNDGDRADRVVAALARLPPRLADTFRGPFAAGLASAAVNLAVEHALLEPILAPILERDDSIASFVKAGGGDLLSLHASLDSRSSVKTLQAARDHLTEAQAGRLLGVPQHRSRFVAGDPLMGASPGPGANWATADPQAYLAVLKDIGRWPEVTFDVLDSALRSLDQPEDSQPSASVLQCLLEVAEAAGLTDQLGESGTTEYLERLFATQQHPGILAAACAWIRRLDLSSSPASLERAKLIIAADNRRATPLQDVTLLRQDLAVRHAELAADKALPAPQRVAHLEVAQQLDEATARATARTLCSSPTTVVRLAAATTLATSAGDPSEHDSLLAVAQAEPDVTVRRKFEAALHRLKSGSAGEALNNLAEMLTLPTGDLDPAVLVPELDHRPRFIEWVDRARSRSADSADPGGFIEAAINLADQMVDLALIARHDAGVSLLKAQQIEALRTNAQNRTDVGALVRQQQALAKFPWFSTVATLHDLRAAHPSPVDSLQPRPLQAGDLAFAMSLLRLITTGWIDSMLLSSQLHAAAT